MKQTNVKPADGKLGILVVGCGAEAEVAGAVVFFPRRGNLPAAPLSGSDEKAPAGPSDGVI